MDGEYQTNELLPPALRHSPSISIFLLVRDSPAGSPGQIIKCVRMRDPRPKAPPSSPPFQTPKTTTSPLNEKLTTHLPLTQDLETKIRSPVLAHTYTRRLTHTQHATLLDTTASS